MFHVLRRCIAYSAALAGAYVSGQSAYAPPYAFATLAGPPAPGTDGTGAAAQFNNPRGLAVDGAGNLYVADAYDDTIRKVTPTGEVTTLAGSVGQAGGNDGAGTSARFNTPSGVAVDGAGNLYVADTGNDTIRRITPGGIVTTIAGVSGTVGTVDGAATAAQFSGPFGVAVDTSGIVYVADTGNGTIRRITPGGIVTTLAGAAGHTGSSDGTGSAALFDFPQGVAVDGAGNVYVADSGNDTVRKITPTGVVTTLAGIPGTSGSADAEGFTFPEGVAVDGAGNVFVADSGDNVIRKVTPSGGVTTWADASQLEGAEGVALDRAGNVYVSNTYGNTILKFSSGGLLTTLAGSGPSTGITDGTGNEARFDQPEGIAEDAAGTLYVADSSNNTIRKIAPDGTVTTLAGTGGPQEYGPNGTIIPGPGQGSSDGTGAAAQFNNPRGVAVDGAGTVYVADTDNDTIRKITPSGVVTTFAGLAGAYGGADGDGTAARFSFPQGVAVDGAGNVYVADTGNGTIRRISSAGVVTTLAGTAGHYGSADGLGAAAQFQFPIGMGIDSSGNVYVGDTQNDTIRKISPAGAVTTLAGAAGQAGSSDGTGSEAEFKDPMGLAVDGTGRVYVADAGNNAIRRITPAGTVTTLAGDPSAFSSYANGVGSAALFDDPEGVAVDGSGRVCVTDTLNGAIREGSAANVLYITSQPQSQAVLSDESASFSALVNSGSSSTYQWRILAYGGSTWANLTDGDGVSGSTTLQLDLSPAAAFNGDQFDCVITDGANTVTTQPAALTVGGRTVLTPYAFTTYSGAAGKAGSADGPAAGALFYYPSGVAVDAAGNVYVADTSNDTIRTITPAGVVATLAGAARTAGSTDALGRAARFDGPQGVAVDSLGNVYVADTGNNTIRKITPAGTVTTIAGSPGQIGTADGTGGAARFSGPRGVAVDGAGNVFVADTGNDTIRKITPAGVVITLAGEAGLTGSVDAVGSAARFHNPRGVAVDPAGNVFVADVGNDEIREVSSSGSVATLLGGVILAPQFDETGDFGIAVDGADNIYVADAGEHMALKVAPTTINSATTWVSTILAGKSGYPGSLDGAGGAARFDQPGGVAVDSAGNVYVADTDNDTIRKITPTMAGGAATWVVTTLAGTPADPGGADGSGVEAQFFIPSSTAVDGAGNVYVADRYNGTIRQITPAGFVTTLAGSVAQSGSADGTGSEARFSGPSGVAVDREGNVYVADVGNYTIREIKPTLVNGVTAWVVSTLAGTAGTSGNADGTGSAAQFDEPSGVAVDSAGNVFVADTGNNTIREIKPTVADGVTTWVVTTLAGGSSILSGSSDGTGSAARFAFPSALAVDGADNIFVADTRYNSIREIKPTLVNGVTTWVVTTLAGGPGATTFYMPSGVAVDGADHVYVADTYNDAIREITPVVANGVTSWAVTLVAGTPINVDQTDSGSTDGPGSTALFNNPEGVAVDGMGNLYVADTFNDEIRKIVPTLAGGMTTWVVTTLAGTAEISGSCDGKASLGLLSSPNGVAVDASGNLYVADTGNDTVRVITSGGDVRTLAGTALAAGSRDGTGNAAQFDRPTGVALDEAGNVYVADTGNNTIRVVTPAGVVTTLAGMAGKSGSADGSGGTARFNSPGGIAVDGSGNVYVADTGNNTIRAITPGGVAATLAGAPGQPGSADGSGGTARFNSPGGIAVDGSGKIYVADTGNNTVRVIAPGGVVTTLAGTPDPVGGSSDGTGGAAQFKGPLDLAVDHLGNVFVGDTGNGTIRRITSAGLVTTLGGTAGQFGSSDGIGSTAQFDLPCGMAVDAAGNVYVADSGNDTIRKGRPSNGPYITSQPQSQTVNVGSSLALAVAAADSSALNYQWTFNGVPIPGATGPTYTLSTVQVANAGSYQVELTDNDGNSMATSAATLTVNPPAASSILGQPVSQTVANGGTVTFSVSLAGSGQTSSLATPGSYSARIFSGTTYQWQFNGVNLTDGYGISGSQNAQLVIQGATAADNGDYTCIVTSAGIVSVSNTAGLVVAATSNPGSLAALSSRAFVGEGNDILIGGFYITGSTSCTVLVQAIGPALTGMNVPGVLQHPALTIHQTQDGHDVVLYSNTGWGSSQVLLNAASAAGALPALTPGSADSEILATLPPGGYTAEITGADGGTGVALCAIYLLP